MYIKQITIQGFKSYKEQSAIESFSPLHNVVVGRNGAGKSNFFAAIRFVLNDAYNKLNSEQRQALLHESNGPASLSAYVEVVFDNHDNRFPTGRDELVLRRTVGLKKDEYSLDRRPVAKADVVNLLEAAGFSRSNPYYIVPQGRVTALCSARDEERLQLLKEVAGTRVYEEHRLESLKIMEETDGKKAKIDELLQHIDERLKELEVERMELERFQVLDRRKRCAEYALLYREELETDQALALLDSEHAPSAAHASKAREFYESHLSTIDQVEAELRKEQRALDETKEEIETIDKDRMEAIQHQAQLSMTIQDLESELGLSDRENVALASDLKTLDKEILAKEKELSRLAPKVEAQTVVEDQLRSRQTSLEARRNALLARQGRMAQFKSASDRDKWIKKEMAALHSLGETKELQISSLKAAVGTLHGREAALLEAVEASELANAARERDHGDLEMRYQQAKQRRDAAVETRKELWRTEAKLDAAMATIIDELRFGERALATTIDRATSLGLEAVKRIAARLGISASVYGPLYELFEVDDVYKTAVEVVAGNSLYHVVVDSDQTAAAILDVMNEEKAGRVTFMPLNRLCQEAQDYPPTEDAVPLIKQLCFDGRFARAFGQIFGKTLVCRDLATATLLSRQYALSGITLEGDRADRKGALTGGFINTRNSRLGAISKCRIWRTRHEEHQRLLADVKAKIQRADQEVTRALSDIQIIDCQKKQLLDGRAMDCAQIEVRKKELGGTRECLAEKQRALGAAETSLQVLMDQIAGLQQEMVMPFADKLSSAESKHLSELAQDLNALQTELTRTSIARAELAGAKAALENELEQNLRRRRADLAAKLARADSSLRTRQLSLYQADLLKTGATIDRLSARHTELLSISDGLSASLRNLLATLETSRTILDEHTTNMHATAKCAERYASRRSTYLQRKEECARKIRELGMLSEEAMDANNLSRSTEQLLKELHRLNEDLKNYSHVNRKAYEQYASFTRQDEQLRERQKELDSSSKAIVEFIKVLDQRKDEAIERTFQQVAANFEQIFERLVPTGHGRLLIIRSDEQRIADGQAASASKQPSEEAGFAATTLQYTGVAIRVSFNSKEDEGLLMSQLSGGQKSLVALALIFAIQRCDPAPFYLFDEIDANLDAAHRAAVASLLGEMAAAGAQFITTTFRPELLEHADKFYGVVFEGKVSRIMPISREQALGFLEHEPIGR